MKVTRSTFSRGLGRFRSVLAMAVWKYFLTSTAFSKGANESGYLRFSAPLAL